MGTGKGEDTISSGIEGAWTPTPIKWDNSYLETLFKYDWDLVKSPAGAYQWIPTDPEAVDIVPDAHDPTKRHAPIMTTADLSLRMDPIYNPIAKHFMENPEELADAFARAWFKLTHRDMGPVSRYLGPEVPMEELIWQDPVPVADYEVIDEEGIKELKAKILNSGLSVSDLIFVAWASASSYRGSDKRGGANGARVRLAPQKDWAVNQPERLAKVLGILEKVREEFNSGQTGNKKVSVADMIVLGGVVAIEEAVRQAGSEVIVPFIPGRTDASQEQIDIVSFNVMEPKADGFRNYIKAKYAVTPEEMLVDKAQLLGLTAPEMTVLLGGLRVLDANYNQDKLGVLTDRPEVLTNDFFVNLLDMGIKWKPTVEDQDIYEGTDLKTGALKWKASRVDLIFGADSELRAIAEVYASDDARDKFLADFITAWNKVMNADRFDVK